jgi:glycosyltransferase involved in cell wall biosynthesis
MDLRQRGYRLAHVFFNDASLICPPVFRVCGFQILISRRDMGYWYTPTLLRLLRITRQWVAGVVVNSQAVADVTADAERYGSRQIHVIYNGYDSSVECKSGLIPELEALVIQGPLALLVANVRPIKRIGDAVAVVSKLKERGCNLTLAVIGDGDTEPLKCQARLLGVEDRVCFPGSRADVAGWLAYGELGLSCSESEGYSNAVVEYMQAGLPVVASDVGGNREAVFEGKTGLRYPVGDIETFADQIEALLVDKDGARAMGQAGKELASQRHDMRDMIRAHARLYRHLIDDKRQASL